MHITVSKRSIHSNNSSFSFPS